MIFICYVDLITVPISGLTKYSSLNLDHSPPSSPPHLSVTWFSVTLLNIVIFIIPQCRKIEGGSEVPMVIGDGNVFSISSRIQSVMHVAHLVSPMLEIIIILCTSSYYTVIQFKDI